MERIKALNTYQKCILIFLSVMFVCFTIAYFVVSSREGYSYKGEILIPKEENGNIIYTGRVDGEKLRIMVTSEKTVTFQYDEKVYGPYTAKEDSSAIPERLVGEMDLTGVEILEGDSIFYRGGISYNEGSHSGMVLFDEKGDVNGFEIYYAGSDGIERDIYGNPIDPLAPSATEILELVGNPKLISKGDWLVWFYAVFISGMTVVHILFADEIFRWNLAFQIRNVEGAEPSEWEITGRYIAWTLLPIAALIMYIIGLTV